VAVAATDLARTRRCGRLRRRLRFRRLLVVGIGSLRGLPYHSNVAHHCEV
jgi:hypothetical protein